MTDDSRRLKHLEVTPEWLVDLFIHGNEIRVDVTDGLPTDTEFRRIEYHFDRDVYWLIIWSSEFEALAEGEPIPETVVEFTDVTDAIGEEWQCAECRRTFNIEWVDLDGKEGEIRYCPQCGDLL